MSVHKGRLMNLYGLKKKKTWTKFYTNGYLKTSKHYEFVDLSREDRHGERTKGKDKQALLYTENINCGVLWNV